MLYFPFILHELGLRRNFIDVTMFSIALRQYIWFSICLSITPSQQTFLSLLRGHNSYFQYQSIVSLVLLRGHNSYHAYWAYGLYKLGPTKWE